MKPDTAWTFALLPFAMLAVSRLCAGELTAEKKFFDPIERDIEGWTIKVDPSLLNGDHRALGQQALKALANHLQRVTYIVPEAALEKLQALPIWLERHHPELSSMQYHPDRGWLLSHKHDPRLVKHVHIPQAKALLDPQMWAKHPYVVLHELAHAYHDQLLSFDDPRVIRAFNAAKEGGTYDTVLSHSGNQVRHYAMNNHKEYFAEATEAYFGVNDFYPFVRAELKAHDPNMFELLESIWGKLR